MIPPISLPFSVQFLQWVTSVKRYRVILA
jgi:hypothetical protein